MTNNLTEDERDYIDYLITKKRYEARLEMWGTHNYDYILILDPIKSYIHPSKRKNRKLWIVK
jgi:hypothetical protein